MKRLIVFLLCFLFTACAQKEPVSEIVTYTISYQSETLKGSVSKSCYDYASRPSQKCKEQSNIVYTIDSYMCDLSGKLYVINDSQNLLQEGFTCTRSFRKVTPTPKNITEKTHV